MNSAMSWSPRARAFSQAHPRALHTFQHANICASKWVVKSAAEAPDAVAPDIVVQEPKLKQKRAVAMHLGYVGTGYKGLQLSRDLPDDATIEGLLELALLKAGLIKESNYGNLFKIKWTRSSRTDKGVHSLSTVVGLKVEVKTDLFETDFEGQQVADALNAHLPPEICVCSVQRTNKHFDARKWCTDRTYEYYLPASILGLKMDGSAEDQNKISLLREALAAYEGQHPFHNYAANRSQYAKPNKYYNRKKKHNDRSAENQALAASSDSTDSESETTEQLTPTSDAPVPAPDAPILPPETTLPETVAPEPSTPIEAPKLSVKDARFTREAVVEDDDDAGDDVIDPSDEAVLEGVDRPWVQVCEWKSEIDEKDKVSGRHYRVMYSFIADDPKPLVPGGIPCLRLQVHGGSFMLNQIRHMIGAAVAVAIGQLPLDLLKASLSAPARVTVPKAPPHTLLLVDATFSPWRPGWGEQEAPVAKYSGERLSLRQAGRARRDVFRKEVFDPALNSQLSHPDWDLFISALPRFLYDSDKVSHVVTQHTTWKKVKEAERLEKFRQREMERLAAAVVNESNNTEATASV